MAALTALAGRDGATGRTAGRNLAADVLRRALSSPEAKAALAVFEEGVHEDDRIVELCSLVLAGGAAAKSGRAA